MKEVILEKYPAYKNSWNKFTRLEKMSFYNMMIAKWDTWDAYSSWLFDIMFEVYNRVEKKNDFYQQRFIGFMAERCLNLYLLHNKIKVAYLPVAVFDKS